jgi:hypothetical protein
MSDATLERLRGKGVRLNKIAGSHLMGGPGGRGGKKWIGESARGGLSTALPYQLGCTT